jgi:hypothetical protein
MRAGPHGKKHVQPQSMVIACNMCCPNNADVCALVQIYEGKVEPWVMSENCTDNMPVLIRRATFCSAFAADARDFRSYNSWVRTLSFLLPVPDLYLPSLLTRTIPIATLLGAHPCFGCLFWLCLRHSGSGSGAASASASHLPQPLLPQPSKQS